MRDTISDFAGNMSAAVSVTGPAGGMQDMQDGRTHRRLPDSMAFGFTCYRSGALCELNDCGIGASFCIQLHPCRDRLAKLPLNSSRKWTDIRLNLKRSGMSWGLAGGWRSTISKVIDQYPKVAAVIAVIVLLSAGFFLYKRVTRKVGVAPNKSVYWYDLTSGRLFPGPTNTFPPIDTENGANQGVLAFVYSCGACTEGEQQIYYLRTLTPEARTVLSNPNSLPNDLARAQDAGELIALPPGKPGEAPKWGLLASSSAQLLEKKFFRACNGQPATLCQP